MQSRIPLGVEKCKKGVLFTDQAMNPASMPRVVYPVSSAPAHVKRKKRMLAINRKMNTKIDEKKTADLKNWFKRYVAGYKRLDTDGRQSIMLKIEHTARVCKNSLDIGKTLKLSAHELRLAEIIALFHDIGRFEQYARYQTFLDMKSENHASLGVTVLKENGVLDDIDSETKNLILRTIQYHNRAALPDNETETCLFFTKLIRDADKLDIWKVLTDYYHQNNRRRNSTLELGLPDTHGFSKKVYQDLMNQKTVDFSYIQNLNDFKLLQLGWIFDINFGMTYRSIKSRGYVELIGDVLPASDKIETLLNAILLFLDDRCRENGK